MKIKLNFYVLLIGIIWLKDFLFYLFGLFGSFED